MEYDFISAVEKRYNNILSLGGEKERSFWQNVGKIVNKQAYTQKQDEIFKKIITSTNKIIRGENK
jgi:hypothetical protein